MKQLLAICLFATSAALVGCGSSGTTSVMESSDQAAIDEYEKLIAEQDAALEAAPPDVSSDE